MNYMNLGGLYNRPNPNPFYGLTQEQLNYLSQVQQYQQQQIMQRQPYMMMQNPLLQQPMQQVPIYPPQQQYVQQEAPVAWTDDWLFFVFAFVVFTVGLAILRTMYNRMAGKTNIKKEVKKRFKNVFGKNDQAQAADRVDNMGFGANDRANGQNAENLIIN